MKRLHLEANQHPMLETTNIRVYKKTLPLIRKGVYRRTVRAGTPATILEYIHELVVADNKRKV